MDRAVVSRGAVTRRTRWSQLSRAQSGATGQGGRQKRDPPAERIGWRKPPLARGYRDDPLSLYAHFARSSYAFACTAAGGRPLGQHGSGVRQQPLGEGRYIFDCQQQHIGRRRERLSAARDFRVGQHGRPIEPEMLGP